MDSQLVVLVIAVAILLMCLKTCSKSSEKFSYDNFLSCSAACYPNGNRPAVILDDGDYPTDYCIRQCIETHMQ